MEKDRYVKFVSVFVILGKNLPIYELFKEKYFPVWNPGVAQREHLKIRYDALNASFVIRNKRIISSKAKSIYRG